MEASNIGFHFVFMRGATQVASGKFGKKPTGYSISIYQKILQLKFPQGGCS